ncbi:protein-L-histidine N-pros-methyltransferase [Condylostylus longicornis]|uniref:protein-L-histidine N-pros-methyltransferase n=1 Tax=Condylostylus longicornis TaxID=2530218 RepID=UPI00244DB47C|nr:protein-L-histidine N-pros-methyltransferase [Condylostylus longicornis]XP_055385822.1 protein-L-histidine N-pros-methyltransferase [Condylostylus longicornis]XP_055385823.1 protein-L-histidine N-pros-methyltransferase [Condylostylus longicornis]XP_055385824.1 protein-L-histidine N-pros-methyltransferase [Condylostylus longicornis]
MSLYKPRGTFARAIFEKVHNDQYLDEYDTRMWYKISTRLPDYFQSKFVFLECPDEITVNWLEKAKMLSANIWIQLWHTVARVFLGFFMTQTDINGFLKRGSMFILSEKQFSNLLQIGGFYPPNFAEYKTVDILDIGAGDGKITIRLANSIANMFNNSSNIRIYATETSWTMRNRLSERQFIVINQIKDVANIPLISCLNVLDRCIDPFKLLKDIYDVLAPNGRVLVALVLPYQHYCEFNTSHMPLQPLLNHWPSKARKLSFETEAILFFETLENFGFKLEAWTKAPYLCEGDLRQSFYWLTDLVAVLSKKIS